MFTERDVDDYLSVYRYFNLSFKLKDFCIDLKPYKACFMITATNNNDIIFQDFYNTWDEAFKSYTEQSNKYLKIITDEIINENNKIQKQKIEPLTEIKIRK